jgi:choline-sulfatase
LKEHRRSSLAVRRSSFLRRSSVVCVAVLAAAGVAFLARRRPQSQPNILLVTLDTTRADHIGAYGYARAKTPRLDRLAADGVLFERALTAAPITLPAHVSLLTGTYPFIHGVRNNGNFALREGVPTLATALRTRGYRTGAFVSAFVLGQGSGLDRGFDVYDDHLSLERRGDKTAVAALEWLKSLRAGQPVTYPFFLWLHLYDPHDPYSPPPPFREAFADRPYDGEIAFDDDVIASVLGEVDRVAPGEPTIVAVVGDHGESLGEHGEATHAVFVYDATLRVPLIVSWPGHLAGGRRVSTPVRSIDLAPTLLDLADVPPLPHAQGRTLAPLARGGGSDAAPPAYAETYFPLLYMNWAPLRSIQDGAWKFIDAPAPELYDLSADAAEQTNLADRLPARVSSARQALDALTGGAAGAMGERTLDRETAAKLASLGYVGAPNAAASATSGTTRPDPKQMIGVFNAVRGANAALQGGRNAEARGLAQQALARDPKNAFATIVLANADRELGRCDEAIAGYRAYLTLVPGSADAHHRIAICYARMGDVDRGLVETEAALAIDSRFGDAHDLRGGLLAERGRLADAARELQAAVEIDPGNVSYRVGLARVLVTAHRLDEADVQLRRALEMAPASADAQAGLGGLLLARGDAASAVPEFERSLALRPEADDVRLDLAGALERAGRAADARREYERLGAGRDTPQELRNAARARLRGIAGK